MSDYLTDYIRTTTEISQSSLLFSILYLFYNANLIEILTDETRSSVTLKYIDDVDVIIVNDIFEKNNRKLIILHERASD